MTFKIMVIGPKLVSCAWIYDTVLPIQINMAMAISEIYAAIMAIFEVSPIFNWVCSQRLGRGYDGASVNGTVKPC
jgi:hypothetical protein